MTKLAFQLLFSLGVLAVMATAAPAQVSGPAAGVGEAAPAANPRVGIDEKIGGQIPLELTFKDEAGNPITLRECVGGKPTILVFAYYRCPMLCTQVLNGLLDAIRDPKMDLTVGKDFNILTVSIDPKETPAQAAAKKASHVAEYGRPGAEKGWRFLTGGVTPIKKLTDDAGFKYEYDKVFKEFNHPSGLIVLTPEGKIARYFYGISYNGEYATRALEKDYAVPGGTTTLRLTLVEASAGKVGSLWDRIVLSCYRFDHLNKGYSLDIMRVVRSAGALTVFVVAGMVGVAVVRERRRRAVRAASGEQPSGVA